MFLELYHIIDVAIGKLENTILSESLEGQIHGLYFLKVTEPLSWLLAFVNRKLWMMPRICSSRVTIFIP